MSKMYRQFCHWITVIAIAAMLLSVFPLTSSAESIDVTIEAHQRPFDFSSPSDQVRITPLNMAGKAWSLCVLVPHMKDEYWISVHSGFERRAKALGASFAWHEAGGYLQLDRQIGQIRQCASEGHDAIIIGAVSADNAELLATIKEVSSSLPVIAFVNELHAPELSSKVAVSWEKMGELLGKQIVEDLPADSDETYRLSLVSGPSESGWAPILEAGLRRGLTSDRIRFGLSLQADSDYHNQFLQVEKAVAACEPNHIVVGSAPAAEAAMSLVRLISCPTKPKIYSTYYSLAVKRGLRSGKIRAASVDYAVLQGWLAVEQAVRLLDGTLEFKQLGPKIEVATPSKIPADKWTVITR